MPKLNVNPTRMELTRLKGKLRTAQRGHKLLKDKRDELMKQFLETVREVRSLRAEVEEELMTVHGSFTVASALMSSEAMEQALLYPKQSVEQPCVSKHHVLSSVPVWRFRHQDPVGQRYLSLWLRRDLRRAGYGGGCAGQGVSARC